ncbi:hypothetical protein QYF36_006893 [Acer negundo]|nr:hypothetical protein QYF36_006893 [Acer negundo]
MATAVAAQTSRNLLNSSPFLTPVAIAAAACRSHYTTSKLVHFDVLLPSILLGGEEQGLASLLQVPSDDGYVAGDRPSDLLVYVQFYAAYTLQWKVWNAILGSNGICIHHRVVAVR